MPEPTYEEKKKELLWKERVYAKEVREEPVGIYYKGVEELESLARKDERQKAIAEITSMIGRELLNTIQCSPEANILHKILSEIDKLSAKKKGGK